MLYNQDEKSIVVDAQVYKKVLTKDNQEIILPYVFQFLH